MVKSETNPILIYDVIWNDSQFCQELKTSGFRAICVNCLSTCLSTKEKPFSEQEPSLEFVSRGGQEKISQKKKKQYIHHSSTTVSETRKKPLNTVITFDLHGL